MGLTERLIQDVERQSGALPLLQFALRELWEKRQGQLLTNAAYHAIGGLDGALEKRADAVLEGFTPAQRELCRRIFLRLTQPGEGTEDTKRRARMQELASAGDGGAAIEEVVDRLVDARLITAAADGDTRALGGAIEVAHEALIRSWKGLRQWIDADRAGLRTHHRLAEAAREWDASGRDPDDLYKGTPLAVCRDWAGSHPDELNPLESQFLAESDQAEKRRKEAEIEAVKRREADARRIAAETKKKLRASRMALVSVLIAIAFAGVAVWFMQSERDRRGRLIAEASSALEIAVSRAADARARRDLTRWEGAMEAGERALSLARSAADHRLLKRVEAEFEEIQRRRTSAQVDAETAKEDAEIRHRLEEARIQAVGSKAEDTAGTFDPQRLVAEYRRIFQDYGIDLDSLPSTDAVRTIQNSAICQSLTAALDDFADSTSDTSLGDRVRKLAHGADPDLLRNAVRDAMAQRDRAALKRIAQEPDIAHFERVSLQRVGRALQSVGEVEEAVAFFRRAQRLHPDDFWLNVSLADALCALKPPRYEEAIRHHMAALALRPDSPGIYVKIGHLQVQTHDLDGAVASLDVAIQKDSHSAWAYCNRGIAWERKREYDKAIADHSEAIRLDPKYAVSYSIRGLAWSEKQEYDKAIADYSEAMRLDPKYAKELYAQRGLAWAGKKEYDKAIEDYNEAIRLDPLYAVAYDNRGDTWKAQKDYEKAIADYSEAIRVDPKYATAYNDRGLAWAAKKEYDKAIADYNEATRLDAAYASAYDNRGRARSAKKEYDTAIADYSEAIRLDPKYAIAYNDRGNAWRANKNYDKAIADYNEAIRVDPKNAHAYSGRASVWMAKKQYDKAIADDAEAIRRDTKDAWAYLSRSVAQSLSGRREAVRGFRETIDIAGWKSQWAAYAVIVGNLAARQFADPAAAKLFLDDSAGKLDTDWPYPIIRFLRGEIDERALLKLAIDKDKETEARCYLGLDRMVEGRNDKAAAHLHWVVEHGNPAFIEYTIASAELERLSKPAAKPAPPAP
jgi:tetratricopeptide (TPR) repeat protein